MQTRRLMIDTRDGMKTLKEEFNWQVRINQRLEKIITQIQKMTSFNAILNSDVHALTDKDLRSSLQEIADYIEKKFNRTMTYQETRRMPSLIQRITADEVMQKRWKLKNEKQFFAPYDAGDDKNED